MNNTCQYDRMIIDGNNLLFRAYYSKSIKDHQKPPKQIIKSFLMMLKNIVKKFEPESVYISWDKRLNENPVNFRKDLSPYKEQRKETEDRIQVHNIIDDVQECVDALGIQTILPYNLEADDVIRFITELDNKTNVIISSDKDLLQLVSERTHVYMPTKDTIVNLDNFERIVGIPKKHYILYKCIIGDKSDNVIGIDRYGPVRAKNLINNYENDDNFTLPIKHKTIIERNQKIMDLRFAEKLCPEEYESYREQANQINKEYDISQFKSVLKKHKLNNLMCFSGEWNSLFNKNRNSDLLSNIVI